MAAIGSTPFERGDEAEGFLIVTSAADKGLVDIHDRRPLVLSPEAAREWMRQDVGGKEAEEIIADGTVPADKFIWHAVTRAVGNVKNQGPELIKGGLAETLIESNPVSYEREAYIKKLLDERQFNILT